MKNNQANIKNWILHNNDLKPGNTMFKAGYTAMNISVTDDAAEKISTYLSTLK